MQQGNHALPPPCWIFFLFPLAYPSIQILILSTNLYFLSSWRKQRRMKAKKEA